MQLRRNCLVGHGAYFIIAFFISWQFVLFYFFDFYKNRHIVLTFSLEIHIFSKML